MTQQTFPPASSRATPDRDSLCTYDPEYDRRHAARNERKVRLIAAGLGRVDSLLDIGCNRGYVLREVLRLGNAQTAHGLEPCGQVVDPALRADERFTLHECDLTAFTFPQTYEAIIYNAVHHHIIGKFGLKIATEVWQRILDHCGRVLIFETGLIAESGEYHWKAELQRLFRTDEEYLRALFRSIGPRFEGVETIGLLPIHDTVRSLYKIKLHPIGGERDLKRHVGWCRSGGEFRTDGWVTRKTLKRTVGSNEQKLIETSGRDVSEGRLWDGTEFAVIVDPTGKECLFAKRSACPFKQMREQHILKAVEHPRILPLVGVSEEHGLLFPYLEGWHRLSDLDLRSLENSADFLNALDQLLYDFCEVSIDMGLLDFAPNTRRQRRFLIDIIDLHPANILVLLEGRRIRDWKVVDLEYFGNENARRNWAHRNEICRSAEPLLWRRRLRSHAKRVLRGWARRSLTGP